MFTLKKNKMLPIFGANVPKGALEKIPYINFIPKDGRVISLLPFFDGIAGTFRVLVPQDDGSILLVPGKPVQGPYYAMTIVEEGNDLHSQLIEYITLSLSFQSTVNILGGIERDIINCSSVVEKYFIFLNLFRSTKDPMIANLVLTDVEFLFANIRSLYDSIQVMIGDILGKVDKTKPHLPDSFYDMVKLEETDQLKKYSLSQPLRKFYSETKEFFLACRTIRTGFQHRRVDIPIILCLDEGFALTKDNTFLKDPVVARFNIWPQEKNKNGLVSLLGLIAYLNKTVLWHMDLLTEALKAAIPALPLISNDFGVFFRGPHIQHLNLSNKYQIEQWIPPK
jgi:hypothetical protein